MLEVVYESSRARIIRWESPLLRENTYIVESADAAILIDPGLGVEALEVELGYTVAPKVALATHMHYDHAAGMYYARWRWRSLLAWCKLDEAAYRGVAPLFTAWSLVEYVPPPPPGPDVDLCAVDSLEVGGLHFEVIRVPGHSPGHVLLYEPSLGVAFTGDLLFKGTVGRTDIPWADHAEMISSLELVAERLDWGTLLLPGHGPATTLEEEARSNPFFAGVLAL